jgi:hypothetical protein
MQHQNGNNSSISLIEHEELFVSIVYNAHQFTNTHPNQVTELGK